jgi:hypothetical protein
LSELGEAENIMERVATGLVEASDHLPIDREIREEPQPSLPNIEARYRDLIDQISAVVFMVSGVVRRSSRRPEGNCYDWCFSVRAEALEAFRTFFQQPASLRGL